MSVLLVLNMTVAIGLINGFIFYANIVAADYSYCIQTSANTSISRLQRTVYTKNQTATHGIHQESELYMMMVQLLQ